MLLISADFFASDFIDETELPPLLEAAKTDGVRILPVILSACRFARNPILARFQAVNPPDRPLNEMPWGEQERVLDHLARAIERPFQAPPRRPRDDSNRERMLAEVRRVWIDGYLQDSLHNVVRVELGLEEKPDALSRPWDLMVQQPDREPRPLPPGRSMAATFDELGQVLLILGAPGAGKTTLFLELARDLLDRAVQDATHPIPVVFHLSSWAARQRPLVDWMADELTGRYYVPRKLAQEWATAENVLPLLDGLDEVAPEHREACVEAINAFRREHPLVAFAVCSRAAEYEELRVRLELSGAVFIRPLSREQIGVYLKEAGKPLAGVRIVLRDDETLWELLETPLMLSIVALTYQGRSAAEVRAAGSLEQRRTHLFENYTRKMFERRTKVTAYTREQTLETLSWLARSLMHNNLSILYVEWMQPDWLAPRSKQRFFLIVSIMSCLLGYGLLVGLGSQLPLWLMYDGVDLLSLLISTLVYGLIAGLIALYALVSNVGATVGAVLGQTPDRIRPVEALRWSWREARERSIGGRRLLMLGLGGGLFASLANVLTRLLIIMSGGLALEPLEELEEALEALVGYLIFGLMIGLLGGFTTKQIVARTNPNEGTRRSLRNALMSLLIAGLIIPVCVAYQWLSDGLTDPFAKFLYFGFSLWLIIAPLLAMRNGGFAYIKHYVLRLLLWRNDYAPLNYVRFLDYAAERVFLRKVGGGYIFTHRLLMEYFASLPLTKEAHETKTA